MPLTASRSYEPQIEKLLSQLKVSPVVPQSKENGFMPDFHIMHEISSAEIRGDVVWSIPDETGKVVGKSFKFQGQDVELRDEAWRDLVRIAGRIYSAPSYREAISQETICDTIFEWLKDNYKGATTEKPLDFLSKKCESKIKEFEVWVPIAETSIEGELAFGKVVFKQVSGAMIDAWEREAREKLPDRGGWTEYFKRWRRHVQGLAAATMMVRAEPDRAYEMVLQEAERSIALLRCLSFFNGSPHLTSYSAPLGQAPVPSYWRFLTTNGMFAHHSEGGNSMAVREYRLTQGHIADLKRLGLDHLDALLRNTKRTSFEDDLLSALLLYSRSSLQHAFADKLTYILSPLEFLLLDGSVDPEGLGERLALLNATDLTSRKNIVQSTKAVYQMRSRLIRGEGDEEDHQHLQAFMMTAWMFFINVIPKASMFDDRAKFMCQIEDWKLSGGLKGAV